MGQLFLVRHGQASLGADNYDQLSALGQRQSERLGAYWRQIGWQPSLVLTGTLKRHRQTLAGIAQGLSIAVAPQEWPGLNEYDAEAVIDCVHPGPRAKPVTPEAYRTHFQLLRQGLRGWMAGEHRPAGMPTWVDFQGGVVSALAHVLAQPDAKVLLVSSGGPISTAIGHVLQMPPETCVELNLRLRNTAVSELSFNARRHSVVSVNTLPHLADEAFQGWITYA